MENGRLSERDKRQESCKLNKNGVAFNATNTVDETEVGDDV
jgi:hypothetical protein